MSKTIDERVLEMRFDNAQFEKNVAQSMSTLDKLKQKLNFKRANDSLSSLEKASKNVNMTGLNSAVDTVHAKFSALEVMGVTALANITNSAMNAGKRIISALTVDPIKTGFQEYETQINSVQTILANTQNKGSTINDVNKALEELNKYADMTIYNFTEMTRNIGTFTAAGIDLETSTNAIQGIANLAAVSGSTSQQASTAMYQLSQALATGTVKLMDWNSVVNAGMGGQVFQDALKKTSEELGTGAEAAIAASGSFRESLRDGWLTADVLTKTLSKFTTSGANEYISEYTGLSLEAVEAELKKVEGIKDENKALEEAAAAMAKKSGKDKDAILESLKFAKTATDAATKVKTFTQLWDVMKESAQSGWAQTWKLIIGDFEAAKALLTPLADFFTGAINKMSEARNTLLESALGRGFTDLAKKFETLFDPLKKTVSSIEKTAEAITDLGGVVDEVILGKFGNGADRYNALTEAGINYYEVQNRVNEALGNGFRHSEEQIAAQNELLGVNKKTTDAQEDVAESTTKITNETKEYIKELAKADDAKLRSMNLTDKQREALDELKTTADKLGMSTDEFIDNMDQINGRWLLINSFKNIGQGLIAVFKAIGDAWRNAFPPMQAETLFDIIAGFHKFTTALVPTETTVENLTRTLKGFFAILDIIATVTGGALRFGLEIVKALFGALNISGDAILACTANVGDAIVAFRDWFEEHNIVTQAIRKLVPAIVEVVKKVAGMIDAFLQLPKVKDAIENIKSAVSDMAEIGEDIINGLIIGIESGITAVVGAMLDIGAKILEAICSVLGIHSPSRKMIEVGNNIIDGLLAGIQNGISKVLETVKGIGAKMVELFGNIDWDKVFAVGAAGGMFVMINKLLGVINAFSSPFEGLGAIFENVADIIGKSEKRIDKILKGVQKSLNAFAFKTRMEGLFKIALAIGVLAASIYVLSQLDHDKMWDSVHVILALATILGVLAIALDKMSGDAVSIDKNGLKIGSLKTAMISIGAGLLLIAAAARLVGGMSPGEMMTGFAGLVGVLAIVLILLKAFEKVAAVAGESSRFIGKVGSLMIRMGIALAIMVGVIKLISLLSVGDIVKGVAFIAGFTIFVKSYIAISQSLGNNLQHISKIGGMMVKMAIALALMVGVVKLISLLSPNEMLKGAAFAAGFTAFVWALTAITRNRSMNDGVIKIGGLLLAISAAMLIMVGVIKLLGMLSVGELVKGGIAIAALTGIIYALVYTVRTVEHEVPKIAMTLLAMTVAIGILAGISIVMGMISIPALAKGIIAVGLLSAILALLIRSTKDANDVKGSIVAMAIAIGVMAGAIALLSLIDPQKLVAPTIAIGTLIGMFSLLAKNASGVTNGAFKSLIVMTVAIALIGNIVAKLAKMRVENVLGTAASMSLLMLSMAAALDVIGKVGGRATNAIKGIGLLTAMVIPLSVFAFALSELPDLSNSIGNVKVLTLLMTAMSALLAPLALIGKFGGSGAFTGVVALTSMILPLVAFGFLIAELPDISGAKTTVIILTQVLTAMTLLLIPLTLIGYLAVGALVGIAALTAMIIPMFAFAKAIDKLPDLSESSGTITSLMAFIGAMTDILIKLAPVAPLAIIGVAAIKKLGKVITTFGILATAVGFLMDKFPDLQSFLDKGIGVLKGIVSGLGEVIGSFISGIAEEIFMTLPMLGACLSGFMEGAQPFLDGIKNVDESVLDNVKMLAEAILLLTAADFVNGLASFDGDTFASLGSQLSAFMLNLSPFLTSMESFDPSVAESVKGLAESILALTKADILNSISSFFSGDTSIDSFGEQLLTYATTLVEFSTILSAGVNTEAIEAAKNAGLMMVELQKAVAPVNGVMQAFKGTKDLGTFGTQLSAYGSGIVSFSTILGEGVNTEAIEAAKNAGLIMVELQKAIEPMGGVISWFTGSTDLDKFGEQILAFGTAIVGFSSVVSAEGAINSGAIQAASDAGILMTKLQEAIPDNGWFDSKVSIDDFGKDVMKFGEYIADYSKEVTDINTEAIATSITQADRLVKITKNVVDLDTSGIASFKKVYGIGYTISEYSRAVASIDTTKIATSIDAANRLKNLIASLVGLDTSGVASFSSAVTQLGQTNLTGFVNTFSSASGQLATAGASLVDSLVNGAKSKTSSLASVASSIVGGMQKAISLESSKFKTAGSNLIAKFASGIDSKKSTVTKSVGSMVSSAVTTARGYYWNFYNAGYYVVSGFASGITANTFAATARARAMAQAAIDAAKETLRINSPSKVFMALGSGVVEGFTKGINDNMGDSVVSATDMANGTINGFKDAISKVSDYLNGDMDVQPTIRPVLDLSDVKSGASAISGMLGMQPSVGVMSNLGAISSMMNGRNQNGANDDVVSAIDKLSKRLGNIGNTSYTINGITYDNGSEISDAISTLVRAAKIERRV